MKSLVIYDLKGEVYSVVISENITKIPEGIPHILADYNENKIIVGVDVSKTPHELILEDFPPSEMDNLRKDLDNAILELSMMIAMGGM